MTSMPIRGNGIKGEISCGGENVLQSNATRSVLRLRGRGFYRVTHGMVCAPVKARC